MPSTSEPTPSTPPTPPHPGRRLLVQGTIAYGLLAPLIFYWAVATFDPSFLGVLKIAAVAGLYAVPPFQAWKGQIGWKYAAGGWGLLVCLWALPGTCALGGLDGTLLGLASIFNAVIGVLVVRVFLINMSVQDYVTSLSGGQGKRAT